MQLRDNGSTFLEICSASFREFWKYIIYGIKDIFFSKNLHRNPWSLVCLCDRKREKEEEEHFCLFTNLCFFAVWAFSTLAKYNSLLLTIFFHVEQLLLNTRHQRTATQPWHAKNKKKVKGKHSIHTNHNTGTAKGVKI